MLARALICVILCLAASSVSADDFAAKRIDNWHQWRGPDATGVAPKGDPPTEWSDTKNIKWKVEIPGRGSASPIVWGNRIYVLTAIKTDRTAVPPKEDSVAITSPVRLVSTESPEGENRTDDGERRRDNDRDRDGERRGRGGRGGFGGGFGRGRGFGIEAPKNFHEFIVLCIDRKTGDTIWQKTAAELVPHEGHHQTGSFASASPITDGKYIYASFGSRGIFCYDMEGNLKWEKDLGDMRTRFSFGEGTSPALHGDTLVVNWDHEGDDFIVALDAATGDEKWRMPRDEPSTWATPLIVEAAGRTQVVTSGSNRVRSYDLASGELIWECGGLGSNPIATPVTYDGLAIAMSGHDDPAGIAVPLSAKGDVTDSDEIAWRIERTTPYVPSPLLYEDTLYFTRSRNAILSSVKAKTGETIIDEKRLPEMDSVYASPVAANGRIYFSSREGTTVVVKHSPTLEVIATNMMDETIDASPAIAGKDLILRTETHLYCISEQ